MNHLSTPPCTHPARRAWGWLAASLLLLGASQGWAADPTASGQSLSTNQNVALNVTLAGADTDGDALSFAITTNPTKGTLSCGLTSGCTSPYAYNYNPAADTDNGTCAYTSCL